jgi:G3E family GTPase
MLLTGFLGAGKTSLLNHLLGLHAVVGRRPALVINEFGTLGVDGHRVHAAELPKYEINSGSIFCACTQAQVLDALGRIAGLPDVDSVLVEATGVAETADLEAYFDTARLFGRFAVRANVCLVDALNFTKLVAYVAAAQHQVLHADGLVLNKSDLVGAAELERLGRLLAAMNPRARQCVAMHGAAPADFFASLEHRRAGRVEAPAAAAFTAATLASPRPLNRERFQRAVQHLGPRLLRLKGHVDFGAGPRFVELAGDVLSEGPPCAGLPPTTTFAAIGWNTSPAELQAAFLDKEPQ